ENGLHIFFYFSSQNAKCFTIINCRNAILCKNDIKKDVLYNIQFPRLYQPHFSDTNQIGTLTKYINLLKSSFHFVKSHFSPFLLSLSLPLSLSPSLPISLSLLSLSLFLSLSLSSSLSLSLSLSFLLLFFFFHHILH